MLQLDEESHLHFAINDFVGRSVAALGITGSGKTNTVSVIIEELLSQGLPVTIIDIEGEYYGLKQSYDLLIAGRSEHAELEVTPGNASALAKASIERGISVILDLSDYTQEEIYDFLEAYFTALWEAALKAKRPYQVVLEEAHEFIPQGVRTPLKQLLTRIALRGRKRGLGLIMSSQRSAKVEKDVLTQTSLLFLHKVIHPTDMRVYKDLIPLPSAEVESLVGKLQIGEAIVVSNNQVHVTHIRLRTTFHAGSTPAFEQEAQPELRRIDASLLADLQKMIAAPSPVNEKSEKRLEKRIQELEAMLIDRDAEIARQAEQIKLLSGLTVSAAIAMPETMQIEQAHISKATINHAQPVQAPVIVEAEPVRQIAQTATVATVPINESKLRALQTWLARNVTPLHMKMLRTLHEQHRQMSVYEIAAWINYSEQHLKNHPPHALLKRGLLTRYATQHGYQYESTLETYLKNEFPGTDIEAIIRRLLP